MSIKKLNAQFKKNNITLYKGEGYFYFVYEDEEFFDTISVMTYAFSHMPYEKWVEEAEFAIAEFEQKKIEHLMWKMNDE